ILLGGAAFTIGWFAQRSHGSAGPATELTARLKADPRRAMGKRLAEARPEASMSPQTTARSTTTG
ncbi:MAG TPA: hypothetical protein VFE78_18270, partial [Gemmataceae bacterium]|nr:hypothetical protein [Gemmataceae bacterium]